MSYKIIQLAGADHTGLASGPFETHPAMTQIAMTERPANFIADMVSPSIPAPFEFKWVKGTTSDQFRIPDATVSRAGQIPEVEVGATMVDGSTDDYGLLAFVPYRDIAKAAQLGGAWDPQGEASAALGQFMSLIREQRVARQTFATGNYETNLQTALTGSGQWSHKDANPAKAMLEALDKCITRPNTLVLGQAVWTALRQNPAMVEAIKGTGAGDSAIGIVTRDQVRALLELENLYVGQTWYNSANEGQDATFARLWGNHAALLHIRRPTSTRDEMPTWGYTAMSKMRTIETTEEPMRGVDGSQAIKLTESCREILSWKSAGYLFQNAI